ncbi:MAG: histidine ammonia-lyase [Planctomycetales bacterium 4484_113]|nr:MAG: histidine ammonia-lyase [Planctomycetales bacterium 4484_113]
MTVVLDGSHLTLEKLELVARGREAVEIAQDAWERIRRCRAFLDEKVAGAEVMYGVTTGIGELSEVVLTPEETQRFQRYLVYSHAAGYGEPMAQEDVRAAMLSRLNVHCHGLSGLRPVVDETLLAMLNRGVTPVVCQRGSVGASGDLSPMGQIALVLMGEGEAFYEGERMPGAEAMKRAGIPTVSFEARDGLAVINGSNVVAGMGALQLNDAWRWLKTSEIAAAMTLEALNAQMAAFDERLHRARGYPGAVASAASIRRITEGSELLYGDALGKKKVQDAYSLRSTPQVTGSARDAWRFAREQFEIELNGVGDNPLFFPDDGEVVTGANFQGTPLGFALELLGIGVTAVSVLSERRVNRLMNQHLSVGLPPFLTRGAGMMSGLMLAQYTAGSLVAENRVLVHPAATGSIPAAADQEDFVSMAMTTAIKTRQILDNASGVLAVELLAGAQALDFRKPHRPGKGSQAAYELVREQVAFMEEDRPLYDDINRLADVVRSGRFVEAVEAAVGSLD